MIDFIYLKKSGLHTRFAKKYSKIDKPISYYLHHTPVIEKGFTVLHLMKILKDHEKDVDLVFLAYSRGFEIDAYYQEIIAPLTKQIENKIDYLEFSWEGSIYNDAEFGKPKYEMSDYVHITGKIINNKERYGFGLDNLNEIKDATFKLDNKIEFKITDYGNIWDENRKPKTTIFFKGTKPFVFENIIGTFINEITFYGYKANKIEFIEQLEKSSEESKLGGGTPHEVVQLKWKKDTLKRWQIKKDSKIKTLKLEKLEKEIYFLEQEVERLKIKYKDKNYNIEV
jgi:hypothetical protein